MPENHSMTRRAALEGVTLGVGAAALGGPQAMAQDAPRKTFVLIHGAWHGGWCWRRVVDILAREGHRVHAVTLTGVGERAHLLSPAITLETHIEDVRSAIEMEELRDIVLAVHSYAGMVGTATDFLRFIEAIRLSN